MRIYDPFAEKYCILLTEMMIHNEHLLRNICENCATPQNNVKHANEPCVN